jgi:hypothetical protein
MITLPSSSLLAFVVTNLLVSPIAVDTGYEKSPNRYLYTKNVFKSSNSLIMIE